MMKREGQCIHFTGIQHDACEAGIPYKSVRDASHPGVYQWPCLTIKDKPASTTCDKRRLPTVEEAAEDKKRLDEHMAKLFSGVSPCCDAAVDESHVNEHGTGPRFCSKCKTFLYRACGSDAIRG